MMQINLGREEFNIIVACTEMKLSSYWAQSTVLENSTYYTQDHHKIVVSMLLL